jgi:uncharacterized protein with NRDE domain
VLRTRQAMADLIDGTEPADMAGLTGILYDRIRAEDNELPNTGLGLEWEKVLSSPFIITPTYGTRASTVLLLDNSGHARFEERSFAGPEDPGNTVHYEFTITET